MRQRRMAMHERCRICGGETLRFHRYMTGAVGHFSFNCPGRKAKGRRSKYRRYRSVWGRPGWPGYYRPLAIKLWLAGWYRESRDDFPDIGPCKPQWMLEN